MSFIKVMGFVKNENGRIIIMLMSLGFMLINEILEEIIIKYTNTWEDDDLGILNEKDLNEMKMILIIIEWYINVKKILKWVRKS